jgi:hypothetical protein
MVDLFNRTWREMNGSEDDVIKAISIVSDQFARAMDTYPNSVEELGHVLQKRFSYFQMLHLWNRERLENEDLELKSVSIQ